MTEKSFKPRVGRVVTTKITTTIELTWRDLREILHRYAGISDGDMVIVVPFGGDYATGESLGAGDFGDEPVIRITKTEQKVEEDDG